MHDGSGLPNFNAYATGGHERGTRDQGAYARSALQLEELLRLP